MTLFAEEPTPRRRKCRACPRMLTDPASIALGFGPCCARKLGITTPSPPAARVRSGGDVPGQTDLLNETPSSP